MDIRAATAADIDALAELRFRWSPPAVPPTDNSRAEFAAGLATWMDARDVVCMIADAGGELVGMAWLVIYERVPNPDSPRRLSGDVQSVYVVPERQGEGIGTLLMQAICDMADKRGVAKLSVDANDRALAFYQRLGFRQSGVLLQREH